MKSSAILSGLAICFFQTVPLTAATLYVKTNVSGTCFTWSSACSLSQALAIANSGDQIWVKSGTYAGPITLVNGVKLIGGFAGTETLASQSNPATNVTVLDGGDADRVIYSSGHSNSTVVRGFTVQNGLDSGLDGGGAVYLENSNTVFVNCTFKDNVAAYFGGVIALRATSSTTSNFVNCKFFDNGTGSGTSVQPIGGGVLFAHSGTVRFSNCLFHNNKAGEAGVAFATDGMGYFNNCTMANNQATFGDGGVILDGEAQFEFRNSILWGNTVPQGRSGPQIHTYAPLSVAYCNVQGGFAGTGNISADPQFINVSQANFDIPVGSPCKDVGSNASVPADVGDLDWDNNVTESLPKDLNLDNRIIQVTTDIGAYEAPFGIEE